MEQTHLKVQATCLYKLYPQLQSWHWYLELLKASLQYTQLHSFSAPQLTLLRWLESNFNDESKYHGSSQKKLKRGWFRDQRIFVVFSSERGGGGATPLFSSLARSLSTSSFLK